jgi:hypothetical protein
METETTMATATLELDEIETPVEAPRGLRSVLTSVLEAAFSRRGLALGFLAIAVWSLRLGWVRPPLSGDLHSFQLSIGLSVNAPPAELVQGPAPILLDSVGVILAILIALGAVLVLILPERLSLAAGLVFCAAIAGNAAIVFNHPALIQHLDDEAQQRFNILQTIGAEPDEDSMAETKNARVELVLAGDEIAQQHWLHGFQYLCYGPWLVFWAGLGVLWGSPTSLRGGLHSLFVYGLAAIGLTCAVCGPRLMGEYYWMKALQLEAEHNASAARQALETGLSVFPEARFLERTWLLSGKIDLAEGNATPESSLYTIHRLYQKHERERALALLDGFRDASGLVHPVARRFAARLWTQAGIDCFRQDRPMAAHDSWVKAQALDARQRDPVLGLGLIRQHMYRGRPDLVEVEWTPLLRDMKDRPLRADLLMLLGNGYYETGFYKEARQRYARSQEAYSLPKRINYSALRGLGGL